MASLYSLFKEGRIGRPPYPHINERFEAVLDFCRKVGAPPNCVLVDIQAVVDDLVIMSEQPQLPDSAYEEMKAILPPFENMWLEFSKMESKVAFQILRHRGKDGRYSISFFMWIRLQGQCVGPLYIVSVDTDSDGDIIGELGTILLCKGEWQDEQKWRDAAICEALVAVHALMRMNCRNCELRPIAEGKHRPHKPNKVTPASVWHEIKITSVPKIQTTGRNATGTPDAEKRAFWIRGHYADYRKGNGLFGNPKLKGVFWIPEYRKGNEELGQVIPEYTIQ